MKRIFSILGLALSGLLLASCGCSGGHSKANSDAAQADSIITPMVYTYSNLPEEPIFDIVTSLGTIKVKLYSKTPKHKENFIKLAKEGFYNGLLFHRVIDGFMIQGGDPLTRDSLNVNAWGTGENGYTVPAEIVDEYYHKKGALCAARKGDMANPKRASSGCQFYIVQDDMGCLHLDGQYTVYGETVSGLSVIDAIAASPTDFRDRPLVPVQIIEVKISEVQDIPSEEDIIEEEPIENEALPAEDQEAPQEE